MGRAPLSARDLERALVRPGGLWRQVRVVAETGSTNSDLLAEAAAGAGEGLVLVAGAQTAGRGRMGRAWASPPWAGLVFSVLLRPAQAPPATLGWIPLLAGLAAVGAVRAAAGVEAGLKWPNDVMVDGRKLAGVLAEARGQAVVAGIGLNVSTRREELAVPTATSLALEAAPARPADLLVALLAELARWYRAWRDQAEPGDPDACGLRPAYTARCVTLGRAVAVALPGGRAVTGTAAGVNRLGQLEVQTSAGPALLSAGDVVHVR